MFEEDQDHLPNPSSSSSSLLPPSDEFSNVMAQLLMGMEELRRSTERQDVSTLKMDHVWQFQADLESLVPLLDHLSRLTADRADPDSVEADLYRNVQIKMTHTAYQTLQIMMQVKEPSSLSSSDENAVVSNLHNESDLDFHVGAGGGEGALEDLLRDYHGAVAQMIELNLRLLLVTNPPVVNENNNNNAGAEASPQQTPRPQLVDEMVQSYVAFQRQTLRARVKPAIAQLVQERKRGFSNILTTPQPLAPATATHHDIKIYADDEDEDDLKPQTSASAALLLYEKHHANTLAVILGQAGTLINPLLAWQDSLPPPPPSVIQLFQEEQRQQSQYQSDKHHPPVVAAETVIPLVLSRLCADSIYVLNEQAQQLTKTVSDWFWIDRPVDRYMEQSATALAAAANDEDGFGGSTSTNSLVSFLGGATTSPTPKIKTTPPTPDLGALDGLVEEMALTCLLLAQYESLIPAANNDNEKENQDKTSTLNHSFTTTQMNRTISAELLPEWSWKYAALERYLALQQWQKVLSVAQPVQIVIGTQIYVPSVVEDAQFLSTRALERASSTRALSAMGTVAHAIAHDIWSTEITGGVHQALIVDEKGCFIEPVESTSTTEDPSDSNQMHALQQQTNSFASALLDALDDDMGRPTPHIKKSTSGSTSPAKPSSGNFLSALTLSASNGAGGGSAGAVNMRLLQMHAKLCALNGIHAASCACRSLVEYLDGFLSIPSSEYEETPPPPQDCSDQPDETNGTGDDACKTTSFLSAEDTRATAMIKLAREELFRFASIYDTTLGQKVSEIVAEYAKALPDYKDHNNTNGDNDDDVRISDGPDGLFLDHIGSFIAHESYNIDAKALQKLERDERLEAELMGPLRSYVFLHQLSSRLELHVLMSMAEHLVTRVVQIVLVALWRRHRIKQQPSLSLFTDWGALLLSKQVRLIQGYIEECLTPSMDAATAALSSSLPCSGFSLVGKWERLTQVVAILQMEQPAEWLMYHTTDPHSLVVLKPHEVGQTMALRVDFKPEAIAAVTNQISKSQNNRDSNPNNNNHQE